VAWTGRYVDLIQSPVPGAQVLLLSAKWWQDSSHAPTADQCTWGKSSVSVRPGASCRHAHSSFRYELWSMIFLSASQYKRCNSYHFLDAAENLAGKSWWASSHVKSHDICLTLERFTSLICTIQDSYSSPKAWLHHKTAGSDDLMATVLGCNHLQ
jgi:hypothetical protein